MCWRWNTHTHHCNFCNAFTFCLSCLLLYLMWHEGDNKTCKRRQKNSIEVRNMFESFYYAVGVRIFRKMSTWFKRTFRLLKAHLQKTIKSLVLVLCTWQISPAGLATIPVLTCLWTTRLVLPVACNSAAGGSRNLPVKWPGTICMWTTCFPAGMRSRPASEAEPWKSSPIYRWFAVFGSTFLWNLPRL